MCNKLNKYNNLNDAHYSRYTTLSKMYEKRYSLFVWYIFKAAAITKISNAPMVPKPSCEHIGGQCLVI